MMVFLVKGLDPSHLNRVLTPSSPYANAVPQHSQERKGFSK